MATTTSGSSFGRSGSISNRLHGLMVGLIFGFCISHLHQQGNMYSGMSTSSHQSQVINLNFDSFQATTSATTPTSSSSSSNSENSNKIKDLIIVQCDNHDLKEGDASPKITSGWSATTYVTASAITNFLCPRSWL